MSDREEILAAHLADLRRQHPMLGDWRWRDLEQRARLQWQIDDLRDGIAAAVGRYGWHAEQDPGNARLAEVAAELTGLLAAGRRSESGSREGVSG
jgi:hypothetical protein